MSGSSGRPSLPGKAGGSQADEAQQVHWKPCPWPRACNLRRSVFFPGQVKEGDQAVMEEIEKGGEGEVFLAHPLQWPVHCTSTGARRKDRSAP